MWRDRVLELFRFARRRKPQAAARAETDPGIVPPIRLPNEPQGVTIHIHSIRDIHSPRGDDKRVDIFDYLLGFLIIGLLVLGGTLWKSKTHEDDSAETPSPSTWVGPETTTTGTPSPTVPPFPIRALRKPTNEPPPENASTPDGGPVAARPPSAIRIVPANYTQEAINARFHGKVFVTVFVDALGVPEKMEPTSPIPFGLERTIGPAVLQWRFEPALSRNGVAVASKAVVEVPFR